MNITVISDTHNKHEYLDIPLSDVIIHCGDFSSGGEISTFKFLNWFKTLKNPYKILVAGNHDEYVEKKGKFWFTEYCKNIGIIYLQDSSVIIDGIKIYGSPYSNTFGNWSFMKHESTIKDIWDLIEEDSDIVITHGPAYGILDLVNQDILEPNVGSQSLSEKLKTLPKIKYHLFGHIHEAYGLVKNKYTSINASIFNYYNGQLNAPYQITIEPSLKEY